MLLYIVRRLLQSIPLLLLIAVGSFVLVHLAPGGPGHLLLGQKGAVQALRRYQASLGLNRPLPVQFWDWFILLLHGNLGYSYEYSRPVTQVILSALPNTVLLFGIGGVLTLTIGVVLGVITATRQYSLWDHILTVLQFVGVSIPDWWLGIMAILLFAVRLRWLPAGGISTVGAPFSLADRVEHLLLPVAVIVFIGMASWSRYMRASMLEVIHQDYMRTARAKGLPERLVVWKHAFRNALIPVITLFGLNFFSGIFAGAPLLESVFAWPGMGYLFVNAAFQRDYPVLLGVTMISGVLIILGNLLADVLYVLADPRIKYS